MIQVTPALHLTMDHNTNRLAKYHCREDLQITFSLYLRQRKRLWKTICSRSWSSLECLKVSQRWTLPISAPDSTTLAQTQQALKVSKATPVFFPIMDLPRSDSTKKHSWKIQVLVSTTLKTTSCWKVPCTHSVNVMTTVPKTFIFELTIYQCFKIFRLKIRGFGVLGTSPK